jgi:signal transduction histidine kinase/DNA-binding response OmpR family regulator
MSGTLRVLCVEDSPDDALLVTRELRRAYPEVQITRVEDAASMRQALAAAPWDVIVCDWSLPGFSGSAALRLVQELRLEIPFLIVSGTIGEEKAADAIRGGADDFVLKDRLSRLLPAVERAIADAKIRAELKRRREQAERELRQAHAELESRIAARTEELRVANERIAREQALVQAAFLVLTDAVLVVNHAGTIELANGAALDLFGPSIVGTSNEALMEQLQVKERGGAPVLREHTVRVACLERGQAIRNVVRELTLADGRRRTVCLDAMPIPGPDGIRDAVMAFHDITEEDALRETLAKANLELQVRNGELQAQEEQLRTRAAELAENQRTLSQRNDELLQASRLKSELLASMSHELRTPLNAIIGFSNLLLAGDYGALAAKQTPVLGDVLAAGEQLLVLINDVLDLSKIEAGKIALHLSSVDVADAVQQACMLVANAARKRSITVENRVQAGVAVVHADPDRLRQILNNLLSNAVKFTPERGVVTCQVSVSGERVRVAVVDTGIGIAEREAHKLFVPFSQLDTGYTRRYQGTGLGLSICKKLVEVMGGEIGFTSEIGKGSTFFFTLPAATSSHALVQSPPSSRPRVAKSIVMLVEDEEPDGGVMERGLQREGYLVARCRSAEEALAMLDRVSPGMFVVDLALPGLSGAELIERIRQLPQHRHTPMAVLTALDLQGDEHARIAASVDTVMRKGEASHGKVVKELARISAARLRVLIVDDSDVNRKVIRAMLQRLECTMLEVADGESGIRAAREHLPTVILMDVQMPGMDGLTATRELKSDPTTSEIPVIAVSAHAMAGDAERALHAGCIAYVSKPVSRARLYDALDVALGGGGWRRALSP